jgi:hypothetical protein
MARDQNMDRRDVERAQPYRAEQEAGAPGERPFPELDPRFFERGTGHDAGSERSRADQSATVAPGKKRHLWGGIKFIFGGPINALGVEHIAAGASVIGNLTDRIRWGPGRDSRVRVHADRALDLQTMAFNAGVSIAGIEMMLANRRRQTARAVLCYAAGAAGFLGLWLWQALSTPAYTRLPYVIVFLMICGLFCLSAFYNALVNWQIRTLRLGTWREFLSTEESWWPS